MSDAISLAKWAREARKTSGSKVCRLVVHGLVSDPSMTALMPILGRLQDLGISKGETIEFQGQAPLGEPIYVCVRETVVALRYEEAELIRVIGDSR